jgi:hypothetical protein
MNQATMKCRSGMRRTGTPNTANGRTTGAPIDFEFARNAHLACLVSASTRVVLCARDAALPEAW